MQVIKNSNRTKGYIYIVKNKPSHPQCPSCLRGSHFLSLFCVLPEIFCAVQSYHETLQHLKFAKPSNLLKNFRYQALEEIISSPEKI